MPIAPTQHSKSETRESTFEPDPLKVKALKIKMREEEAAKLGQIIDGIMNKANEKTKVGCFAWVVKFLTRSRSSTYATTEVAASSEGAHGSASSSSSATNSASASSKSLEVNSRIFGLAGAKKASDPAKMLEQAASVMRARIEQLEQRAAEQRSEAARLVQSKQKSAAMRALKKAKQLEASVAANSASLDAVEQQVDMLAQAAVQKTLTSALETTSKSMKKDTKIVARAEKAVDDMAEVRDQADDLNAAMSELANQGPNDIDEDELLEELEAMMESAEDSKQADAQSEDEAEFASEKKKLSSKAASAASSAAKLSLPSVPRRKVKEEKKSLLADDGAVGVAIAG